MDIDTLRARHPEHWMRACAIRTLTLDAVAAANSGHSGETTMRLSAPTHMTFYISVALFVLALVGHFAVVPYITMYQFWLAIAGYVVLAAGNLLKGV